MEAIFEGLLGFSELSTDIKIEFIVIAKFIILFKSGY